MARRRRSRISRVGVAAALVVLIAVIAAVLILVFRVRSVEVTGLNRYTPEQIKNELIQDFKTENTLYLAWKYRRAESNSQLPYLETVQVKFVSPGKVRVIAKEKTLYGCVQYAGSYVYFDADGLVLEVTSEERENIPVVSGAAMGEPVLYQKLSLENTAQMRTMLSVTQLLSQAGLCPDLIAFDENLNMTLQFADIDVKLGQDEYLEEKIANLVTLYQEIKNEEGTLNMESFTGKSEAKDTITFKNEVTRRGVSDVPADGQEYVLETDVNGNIIGTVPVEGTAGEDSDTPQYIPETDEYGDAIEPPLDIDEEEEPAAAEETVQEEEVPVQEEEPVQEEQPADSLTVEGPGFMVFDSSGTLRYDAHIRNGQVVDSYGNPIDGCTVTDDGYAKDAYWNIIDPSTGQPINL